MKREEALELCRSAWLINGDKPELYCRLSEWFLCYADFVPGGDLCANCKCMLWGIKIGSDKSPIEYEQAKIWLRFYRVASVESLLEGG